MSVAIPVVTFNQINANKWAAANNEYTRMLELRVKLAALSTLWIRVANAADPEAITAAYKALQDSKIKIVDLTGINPEEKVYLGGSRGRRQSKKRKNHKKHNNNQ